MTRPAAKPAAADRPSAGRWTSRLGPRQAAIALALAALVGLVVSGFLTWDHQVHQLAPSSGEGLCAPGSGCEISRTSAWSEVSLGAGRPGLPIALAGLACYLVVLGLAALRAARPALRQPPRLLLALAALSVLYSVVLAAYSLHAQGKLCPWCTVLYGVNAVLLVVALLSLGERVVAALGGLASAIFSGVGAASLLVFVGVAAVGYQVYAGPLEALREEHEERLARQARQVVDTPVFELDNAARPTVGPADAPVEIVEFADFACPHCGHLYHTVHAIQADRPGQIRLVFRHFPLDASCNPMVERGIHPNACLLAAAADCAWKQDRFHPMAEWLFANARAADREAVAGAADELGLDVRAFLGCLDDPATLEAVTADAMAGGAQGVRGTPVFFLNGHRLEGSRPRKVLEVMIDSVLAGRAPGG